MKKKILALILALALVLPVVPVLDLPVAAATSGTTGACTWALKGTVLTISGSGEMGDYTINGSAPWGTTITKVIVENGVTSIGNFSFYNCKSITQVVIPNSIKTLGDWCFYNCSKLSTIEIPDQVTTIANGAFAFCNSLTSIKLPNGVISIRAGAFRGCSSLTSIEIPNNVYFIGESAFSGCTKLTSIKLPKSITTVYDYTFDSCKALTEVWYEGSREDRSAISINSENDYLTNAIWHYNFCFQNPNTNKTHIYDHSCDTTCNLCGTTRSSAHTFDNVCDTACNECGATRIVNSHAYSNACDKICNICFSERTVPAHVYDTVCDTTCNECGEERTVPHNYSVRDKDGDEHWMKCSVCGTIDETTRAAHIYDNAYDTICNVCAYERFFAGGSGTETSPYLIETKEHLNNVRNHLDAHYKMIADIVFTEADFAEGGKYYNSGKGWVPFDTFTGTFDGNGYSIENLYAKIYGTGTVCVGLFGYNEGVIKNLSMINSNIIAWGYVGSVFHNVDVYAGAIAGRSSGSILNCYSSGRIDADAENAGTSSSATYYKGYVYAGGIVGSNTGSVTNSYNSSSVTSYSSLNQTAWGGGIAGSSDGSIKNSYNLGDVSNGYSGGIVGKLTDSGSIQNCYYLDKNSRGVGDGIDAGKKCTLQTMTKQETFSGFDFINVWKFDSSFGYLWPVLQIGYVPENEFSITVTTKPTKLTYLEGDSFDSSGMVVAANYNNTSTVVTDYTISGYNSTPGTKNIVVSYCGETASFVVEVKKNTPGDLDGKEGVDVDDAIYLLYHSIFPTAFPVTQPADFDENGLLDLNDALYLLYHVNFPGSYPLNQAS